MLFFRRDNAGIGAAIISNGKVLLIKRRRLPFVSNPGAWSFLFGGTGGGEQPVDTAYREIREETGLGKEAMRMAAGPIPVEILETRRPSVRWRNSFYVFYTDATAIRLSWENAKWRWADFEEILQEREYTNLFVDRKPVEQAVREALQKA